MSSIVANTALSSIKPLTLIVPCIFMNVVQYKRRQEDSVGGISICLLGQDEVSELVIAYLIDVNLT